MKTFIFSKNSAEISEFKASLKCIVTSIDSCELQSCIPCTEPELDIEFGILDDTLHIKASGGYSGVTYTCKFLVKGDTEQQVQVVILVSDSEFDPIVNSAPDSFMDLVGTMRAGESTVSTVIFNVPTGEDVTGYTCNWELLNDVSEVLASGNAFDFEVANNGLDNTVIAKCVIVCPSYLEPTSHERRYQIRYSLTNDIDTLYQYETLTVQSNVTVPLGSPDIVEFAGRKTTLSLVTPSLYANCSVCIYANNTAIVPVKQLTQPQRVSSGWLYTAKLDTSTLPINLDNYDVVFEFWNNEFEVNSESSKLWIINPSIKNAVDDILAKVMKAHATLYGSTDLIFTVPTVLTWLRRGRDLFNGWQGLFTGFSMTNAKGVIREYWLLCSELGALEAQYLAEGEKAFDFSGAAISLNVDRTGFLDSMINAIRSNLDQNLKPIKQNLIQKGYVDGDGAGTDGNGGISSNIRSMGAVGISITPASAWSRFSPYFVGLQTRAWL